MKLTEDGNRIEGRGITLEQLRAFVFIAEHRSFGSAGEALGRTQSTLSAGLRRLEEDVGCRLIERKQGHILGLTDEGRQLLPAARDILARTSRALGALSKRNMTGQIALGVPDDFETGNLNRIISLCLEENPGLKVQITSASSAVLSALAARQEIDVVITKSMAGQPLTSENDRLLWVETLHWVSAGTLNFNQPDEIPLVTFPEGCVIRHCAVAALENASRRYYFSYVSGSFNNIRSAAVSGLGIGLLPKSALTGELYELTPQDGAPSVPAIQLILSIVRPGRLNQLFSSYIERGLMR
ncbi:Morphology and auto-aggregation control protein [Shimwellia blattae]|nr:putative LysR family transcriptional regulator [Shimwellia blattae DSM 4481 = NBRC 105725]VDY65679.1 Morphology and auto-aggregation control protein [Shimwellia blattae]VEC25341.1 Morphology and auto-aggregation control protein [Shimwellia blattae]